MARNEKGQIYSLDFLIAAGLLVLAIGILLGIFETSTYHGKEARVKNELNAVALTASNALLGSNKCPLDNTLPGLNFSTQGYRVYGCYNTNTFANATKSQLLVPAKFKCRIEINGAPTTSDSDGCQDILDVDAVADVASVERTFLSPITASLTKKDYERCIAAPGCTTYGNTENKITVKVWFA